MTDKELYLEAKKVKKNAYVPYSKFCVGAALLAKSGKVYTGVNIENSSYPAGICAERAAFSAAVSAGERKFDAIAICGGEGEAMPCGICRQFMYEFSSDCKLRVITGKDENHLEEMSIGELLVKGFRL